MQRPVEWKALPEPDAQLPEELLGWFEEHGREFAWRKSRDPFHLLCVELMLQRTRASQVEPVFQRFMEQFSTPEDLLGAGRKTVDEIFAGLGLRWRAEYFWELQHTLVERFNGEVPEPAEELLDLPGVGRYAATAVRVFAFGHSETVLDSNVLRVMGRFYGIDFPDHARRSPRVADWARRMCPPGEEAARRWNWALIDYGATMCSPNAPRCSASPLCARCWHACEQR